jgi:hypothetical protein
MVLALRRDADVSRTSEGIEVPLSRCVQDIDVDHVLVLDGVEIGWSRKRHSWLERLSQS